MSDGEHAVEWWTTPLLYALPAEVGGIAEVKGVAGPVAVSTVWICPLHFTGGAAAAAAAQLRPVPG